MIQMNDREKFKNKEDAVSMYMAIQRKKDNPDILTVSKEKVMRKIAFEGSDALEYLEHQIKRFPGKWRIYKSINKRSCEKARKLLMKELIDNPQKALNLEALWKTVLMQPECKCEKNYLIDCDSKDESVVKVTEDFLAKVNDRDKITKVETPNGYHFVVANCDTRVFECTSVIEVKRDAMVFVKMIEVK